MAEGQNTTQLIREGNVNNGTSEGFEAQVSTQSRDQRVEKVNTSGNNQVGEGNTQIITGSRTHTTINNNYHVHIENYHQNGNEPFSRQADNQLSALTSTSQASTQTQGSTQARGSSEEGSCSCQILSNTNGIECPQCGHVIPNNESMLPNAEHLLETNASSVNSTARSVHVEMDSVSVTSRTYNITIQGKLINDDRSQERTEAVTVVGADVTGDDVSDGDDDSAVEGQTSIFQRHRSFDELSVLLHDYCGPISVDSISPHRNAFCQTPSTEMCTASNQTDDSFLEAIYSRKKDATLKSTVGIQTESSHTCEEATQVLLPPLTHADIKKDAELVNFYTGLNDGHTFSCLFDELSETYEREYPSSKFGRPKALSLIDQFLMVLMRLRLGLLIVDIANRFHVSRSTCAQVINRWINLMYNNLSFLISWPKRNVIDATMPKGFKYIFPETRVVIDCTELFTEKPHSIARQSQMYSHYKSHITFKALIGVTPNGVVSFVSDLWSGAISDRQITIASGILNLCEFGDAVMADKGFLISDLTTPKGLHLIIPPLKRKRKQFSLEEIKKTRRIANLRIHVERHMERVKNFRILQGIIPITISKSVNKIWKICNALTTLLPPPNPHDCDPVDENNAC